MCKLFATRIKTALESLISHKDGGKVFQTYKMFHFLKDEEMGKGQSLDSKPLEEEFKKSQYAADLHTVSSQILNGLGEKTGAGIQEQLITYPSSFFKQVKSWTLCLIS